MAQENKIVILNLKNGYSVKGEIVEQSAQTVKIKTQDGQIVGYKTDEIVRIVQAKSSERAQSEPFKFDKSKLQFNFGIGLSTRGIPLYVGADYFITPDITIGLEASIRYRVSPTWYKGYIGGSVNGNYHFTRILQLPENLDVYGGLSVGPYFGFGKTISYGYYYYPEGPIFGIDLQVGGRYKINDKMWVNAELGLGSLTGAKIGITLRR
ncbi:MAG: hypothetical protein D4R64_18885 [Porphyromonadaceae bacterium]|nr:MAG: hypothetical protein D4R64_18885 [Porphyromonadaceae bacterium]